jgi:hypothetical protein
LNTPYIELSMWCNYIQESLQDSWIKIYI